MNFKSTFFTGIILILMTMGCSQNPSKNIASVKSVEGPDSVYIPTYANRFKISYYKNYKVIEVIHPWDSTAQSLKNIVSSNDEFLSNNPDAIRIPVKRWVAVASTQISYANALGVLDQLVGMAEPEYVSNPIVRKGIQQGSIRNIGSAFAPDAELLMSLNPDMMMISPFKDDFYGPVREAGIKLATNCSYLENTPLGRVEWLVFVSAFFNKEAEAVRIVNDIAIRYNKVKEMAQKAKEIPSVVSGKTYQGIWYVAAAESYNANFLKDSNVRYIYDDRHGTGSHSYDFETVYNDGGDADYWLMMVNYDGEFTYSVLKSQDERYVDFKAYKNKSVIFSNTHNSLLYEKGLLEPDVVLADLVSAFHGELFIERKPVYFRKLEKE